MTPQYMSTAKKLAILDNDALGQFAEANKNDAMMLAMAMSEKARRDAIKADQMAQAAPMGMQPTVKEQKVAELRQRAGLAALPASNMEAMGTRAAKGGIMTYAGGGFTNAQIIEMVRKEAAKRGINPDTAERILRIENSKLDPKASPKTSTAFGLFQTTDDTWNLVGGDPKKKDSVEEQIRVGLNLIQDNDTKLGDRLGRQPTPSESYAAHFFGLGNALKVLNAEPGAKIEDILVGEKGEKVIAANKKLLAGKTAGDVIGAFTQKMGVEPAKEEVPAYLSAASVPTAEGIAREQAQTAQNIAAERARVEGLPVGERLLGAGEAGLSALTGAASIPVAGAMALFGPRQEGESAEQAFARRAEAMTFAPRTAEGQRQLKEFGKAIEETKLPPVLPGVMGTAGTTPARRGAISDAAFLAGKADEAQAAVGAAQRAATPALPSPQAAKRRAAAQQAQAELSASERVLGTTPRELAEARAEQAAAIKASQDYRFARETQQLQNELAAKYARLRALGVDTKEPPVQRQPRNLVMEAQETATRARLSPLEQKVRGLQGILDEKKKDLTPTAGDRLAAEQRAEAAARAQLQAQERAAAALPEAQRRAAGAMSAADEAVARAAQAPGQQLVMPVVTPTAALAGPKPEGGIRDLAKGTAAPIAAMTPDEQAGLASQTAAFARGEEPDFEVGDPAVLGEQFVKNLPKEEQEGLRGLLGKLDNDFYLSLGIGLLSQPDFGQGLAYGTQLYMTRKDAKTKAEAKAKETASEIAEREARAELARAQTKVLESGDRNRATALKMAQDAYEEWVKDFGKEGGALANQTDKAAKLAQLQRAMLAEFGLTPRGMSVQSSSLMPGFKLLGQD